MTTRNTQVEIGYNGVTVSTLMNSYVKEVTYSDPASGEADSLDISIHDRERKWTTNWLPAEGDIMTAIIKACDESKRSLVCGLFILDSVEFSGWPINGTVSGVSVPVDSSFRTTARTKNWENVTIKEIGKEIADRAGISLVWDVEGEPFTILNIEQSEQTDCNFFKSLCESYGLAMKVYFKKIVVYDREFYKKKDSVDTITAENLLTWSWSKNTQGTYTGGEYTYTDPNTEEEIKVVVGGGNRILKQSGKADNTADAERKIRAAVDKENHGSTKLTATIIGNAIYVASQCIDIVGLGSLSGKYYIDNITHNVSGAGGYTMDLELALVEAFNGVTAE